MRPDSLPVWSLVGTRGASSIEPPLAALQGAGHRLEGAGRSQQAWGRWRVTFPPLHTLPLWEAQVWDCVSSGQRWLQSWGSRALQTRGTALRPRWLCLGSQSLATRGHFLLLGLPGIPAGSLGEGGKSFCRKNLEHFCQSTGCLLKGWKGGQGFTVQSRGDKSWKKERLAAVHRCPGKAGDSGWWDSVGGISPKGWAVHGGGSFHFVLVAVEGCENMSLIFSSAPTLHLGFTQGQMSP